MTQMRHTLTGGHRVTPLEDRLPPRIDREPPRHDARTLTGGGQLAHLELDGQVYILRITRAGKLILTK